MIPCDKCGKSDDRTYSVNMTCRVYRNLCMKHALEETRKIDKFHIPLILVGKEQ